MSWGGLNNALTSWRNGVNERFPDRSTRSDGGYADSNHASSSEHQPDDDGTVDAFDMDNNLLASSEPNGSPAERALLEALKLDFEADRRSYLWISHREIASRGTGPWRERAYGGDSPHDEHTHWQSVQSLEDDGRPWKFTHTDALIRQLRGDLMDDEIALTDGTCDALGKPRGTKMTAALLLQYATLHAARASKATADLAERLSAIEARLTAVPPAG